MRKTLKQGHTTFVRRRQVKPCQRFHLAAEGSMNATYWNKDTILSKNPSKIRLITPISKKGPRSGLEWSQI